MYSNKEKIKHLRSLDAPNQATRDLALLKKLDPRNDQLATFEHAPSRNSERILYALLDVTTAETIRNNRRTADLAAAEQERLAKEAEAAAEQERLAKEAEEKADEERELRDALDDAETELERSEDEIAELEEKVETLEEQLEEKEAELEAEKKSDPTPTAPEKPVAKTTSATKKAPTSKATNAKKKTSTRPSTGKTSKTKTSK